MGRVFSSLSALCVGFADTSPIKRDFLIPDTSHVNFPQKEDDLLTHLEKYAILNS